MKKMLLLFFMAILFTVNAFAQAPSFKVIPLGVKGGLDESNLSSYMAAPVNSNAYVCLDAGTLYAGIRVAKEKGNFSKPIEKVLRENIKGYLISHGHLDHLAGLVINSPGDTSKNIYGMSYVIDVLKNNYFTWQSWANFADEGEKPLLKKYHYVTLETNAEIPLDNTSMTVRAFPLSHGNPYQSTAFLLRHKNAYLLYLGDTGADEIEHSDKMKNLWRAVGPLIKQKQLKAIFIETSYPNEQPDNQLFGHLTPKWLMKEMDVLSSYAGKKNMKGLPVVITHIKPSAGIEQEIKKQILSSNKLGLKIIVPEQGRKLVF